MDRLSWGSDGVGPTTKSYTHVFVVDALVGGTPRQISSGNYSHSGPEWSADGRTIYVSGIRKPDAEYLRGDSEIYAINVATLGVTALTDRKGPDSSPIVSPDGKWIAYTGYNDENYTSTLSNLYLMDAGGGNKRLWQGNLPSSPGNVNWAFDGSGVYYSMEERGEANEYFLALAPGSAPRKITSGAHVLTSLSIARNGQVAAIRSSARQPGVLVTFALNRPADVKTLVDVNADVLDGVALAEPEEIWYSSTDGLKIQGWLMKPANFDPVEKVSLGALDPRRTVEHVQRRLELGLPELGRQRLRGALDQSAGFNRLRPGVRQRHSVLLSG